MLWYRRFSRILAVSASGAWRDEVVPGRLRVEHRRVELPARFEAGRAAPRRGPAARRCRSPPGPARSASRRAGSMVSTRTVPPSCGRGGEGGGGGGRRLADPTRPAEHDDLRLARSWSSVPDDAGDEVVDEEDRAGGHRPRGPPLLVDLGRQRLGGQGSGGPHPVGAGEQVQAAKNSGTSSASSARSRVRCSARVPPQRHRQLGGVGAHRVGRADRRRPAAASAWVSNLRPGGLARAGRRPPVRAGPNSSGSTRLTITGREALTSRVCAHELDRLETGISSGVVTMLTAVSVGRRGSPTPIASGCAAGPRRPGP